MPPGPAKKPKPKRDRKASMIVDSYGDEDEILSFVDPGQADLNASAAAAAAFDDILSDLAGECTAANKPTAEETAEAEAAERRRVEEAARAKRMEVRNIDSSAARCRRNPFAWQDEAAEARRLEEARERER